MLWHVVVHESGERTLADTVLHYPHFLREVPVDISMALFVWATIDRSTSISGRENARAVLGAAAIAASVLLVLTAFIATAAADGLPSALLDLGQYRTRDTRVSYGSHWRYHWLSTLWFGIATGLAYSLVIGERRRPTEGVNRLAVVAWGYFLAMTLLFGLEDEVFFSPLYAGHQAREIATHGAITLPLALGCLRLTRNAPVGSPRLGQEGKLRFTALVLICVWLTAVMAGGDIMAEGQSANGLSAMVAGHLFEHSLDYLAVVLLACGLGLLSSQTRTSP